MRGDVELGNEREREMTESSHEINARLLHLTLKGTGRVNGGRKWDWGTEGLRRLTTSLTQLKAVRRVPLRS